MSTTAADTISSKEDSWERIPVVRRLYGGENSQVRQNVAELEERMYRYQTGLAPDPHHEVPYEYHPYTNQEPLHSHRRLEDTTTTTDLFDNIRIHFETEALDSLRDSTNGAKIDCTFPVSSYNMLCKSKRGEDSFCSPLFIVVASHYRD